MILVGDLHAQLGNLEESLRIMDWAIEQAKDKKDFIVMLGDTLNNFGVVKTEELRFLNQLLEKLEDSRGTIILTGNHDQSASGTTSCWDLKTSYSTRIISEPTLIDSILFLPFIRKHDEFKAALESFPEAVAVICHQDFDGSRYDNGFYAPHGYKAEDIPSNYKYIISGHIHSTQTIKLDGREIFYPGIPRQLTRSNLEHIPAIYHMDKLGSYNRIEVPENIAPRFKHFVISKDTPLDRLKEAIEAEGKVYVDIEGDQTFVKKMLKTDFGSAKVRSIIHKEKSEQVSEPVNLESSFMGYLLQYTSDKGLGNEEAKILHEMLKESLRL